jgi:hypothetical protein
MSWKMISAVRQARMAGLLPTENFTQFAVLLIMADTCRADSHFASIGMAELVKLSGQERTSMSRAIAQLEALGYLRTAKRGNQFTKASLYEVLPNACGADATSSNSACGADATSNESDGAERVAFATEDVAFESSACGADATLPVFPVFPEGEAPPRFCPKHMPDGTIDSCPACGHHRKRREAWDAELEERVTAARNLIRQAINKCRDCDAFGRLDDLTDCPKHRNFRQYPELATRAS